MSSRFGYRKHGTNDYRVIDSATGEMVVAHGSRSVAIDEANARNGLVDAAEVARAKGDVMLNAHYERRATQIGSVFEPYRGHDE